MFELLSGILFSISTNIDNIPIGISYGLKKVHISLFKIFFIVSITSVITFFSMYAGQNISTLFNIKYASFFGALTLIGIGTFPYIKKIILLFLKHLKLRLFRCKNLKVSKNKKNVNSSNSKKLSIKELMLITTTLSLNNIATGIIASMTGINILCATISTLIFGTLFLYFGNNIGKKINNKKIERYSSNISSLILILLGLLELML